MSWKPLSKERLSSMMSAALAAYDDRVRAAWAQIRIEPEKWRCSPMGDEGGGFWAVAVNGRQVLWFNDIEDGFNWSEFSEPGTIAAYACDQIELADVLEQIAQKQRAEDWASLREGDAPVELAEPGSIVRRQTTYWEVRADSGALYRVHFQGKQEVGFAGPAYATVELVPSHPLLVHYDEPTQSLYFNGRARDPAALAVTLDRLIQDASSGWRSLAFYAGSVDAVERLLRTGFGLLMKAPASLCGALAAALTQAGVQPSLLDHLAGRPEYHVLLLGRSYVIARSFAFERCW